MHHGSVCERRQQYLTQRGLATTEHLVERTYEDCSAAEVLSALLPVPPPRAFETVGTIAHFNLREDLLPYRYAARFQYSLQKYNAEDEARVQRSYRVALQICEGFQLLMKVTNFPCLPEAPRAHDSSPARPR